ncbi:MAG: nitrilase family protein [Flavobacteriales bacterium]|nr:MAG: nitrilase family protein [Flavobacteriales bacterium]
MKTLNLNIAYAQLDLAWKDPKHNCYKIEQWLDNNKQQTDLVILPEMFTTGFVTEPREVAETMQGETITWLQEQAKRYNLAIIGSLIIEEQGRYYNRLFFMDRHGEYQTYDKRHLFTYGGEHKKFDGGKERLIVELNGWRICPMICYDLRFPVWSKNTYQNGQYDYDVLIYIANWPSARAHAFRQLLVARAIENQAYVVGVNRIGVDGKGLYYQGNTTALDFKGHHISEIEPDEEAWAHVSLSHQSLEDFRQSFPLGMDWDTFTINS